MASFCHGHHPIASNPSQGHQCPPMTTTIRPNYPTATTILLVHTISSWPPSYTQPSICPPHYGQSPPLSQPFFCSPQSPPYGLYDLHVANILHSLNPMVSHLHSPKPSLAHHDLLMTVMTSLWPPSYNQPSPWLPQSPYGHYNLPVATTIQPALPMTTTILLAVTTSLATSIPLWPQCHTVSMATTIPQWPLRPPHGQHSP